jgi:RNA polymerase sigma factor (sigma-70 family)
MGPDLSIKLHTATVPFSDQMSGTMRTAVDDEARFRAAFERHYDRLLAYAMRRTTSRDDAEEAVATSFATAWRRIDALPEEPGTIIWLYRVTWRTLANQRRSNQRRTRLISRVSGLRIEESTVAPDAHIEPIDARLLQALAALKPREREVLQLIAWEELSYAEAAEVLGCSPNAFAIRLHRARVSLRDALATIDGDDVDRLDRDE